MPLCNEVSVVVDQDGQARSLIQTEAHTYGALPLIPNPISAFLVQHANRDLEIVVQESVIKAAKDWLAQTLAMIAAEIQAV